MHGTQVIFLYLKFSIYIFLNPDNTCNFALSYLMRVRASKVFSRAHRLGMQRKNSKIMITMGWKEFRS